MSGRTADSAGLARGIRGAVSSGEFSKARLLWEEYGERFRADLLRGPLPQSRLAEARELAEWTRLTALCARAQAQARLNQIAVARTYADTQPAPRTTRSATF